MREDEIKQILEDPKKLLDLFRVFHQLIHIYEVQEMKKEKPGSKEKIGLNDSISIQLNHREVKQ